MLKNYLKTILRNISRNKSFTLINIFGLSVGLAAFISITQYVRYETQFDSYNPNAENIVRIGMEANLGDGEIAVPFFGPPVAATLAADFPEVEASSRLMPWLMRDYFVKYKELELKEKSLTRLFADANFFEFFAIPLLMGDETTALAEPNSVVLSESTAEKYFGPDWRSQQVLGELIEVEALSPLKITGISADVPDQTHFNFSVLVSINTLPEVQDNHWFSNGIFHYLRLNPETDREAFLAKVDAKAPEYLGGDLKDFLGTTYEEIFSKEGNFFNFFLQTLESIHLDSHYELELAANGNRTYVTVFSAVSVLVLLMASINFMNLSTVTGLKRYKEVGVRKVLGSLRHQLIGLFLLESCLVVLVSLVLAVTTIQVMGPWINNTVGMEIISDIRGLVELIVWLVAGGILLGLLSGFYPAILLSSLSMSKALKGGAMKGRGKSWLRNGLIVFQFSISMLLIIGVTGISDQLEHLRSRDLGYTKDQVLVIKDVNQLGDKAGAFKDAILANASVSQASLSGFVPIGSKEYGNSGYRYEGDPSGQTFRMRSAYVDADYLATYGINLLAGRGFAAENENESEKIVVNQQMVKIWNWSPEEAIGKQIINIGNNAQMTIIGVVKDFQFNSLKESVQPFFLEYGADNQALAVRFDAADWTQVRADAKAAWSEVTDIPFSYTMASDLFESVLAFEMQANKLFKAFSFLAILIGGLGLLAVASYVITQRSKEVGIRKVLGASVPQLFKTLSGNFIFMIFLAGIISIPVAYFLLQDWVSQYAYQAQISWMWFAAPFTLVLLMAFCIVGIQVWKVAVINPVKSLRYE